MQILVETFGVSQMGQQGGLNCGGVGMDGAAGAGRKESCYEHAGPHCAIRSSSQCDPLGESCLS